MTDVDVVVVGAGIAGLTAAHELRRAGVDVLVLEERPHVGGRMHSFRHGGYVLDEGAEQVSPHSHRATWELLARLGFSTAEVPRIGRPLATWRDGRARPGLATGRALLTGAGLGPRARADLARLLAWTVRTGQLLDLDRPERTPGGARTVAEFCRQYHPDLHDYLFQPLTGCFFGWSTARSAVAPVLCLLRAAGPADDWRTYRDGMDTLARRLAEDLPVALDTRVHQVVADRDSARVVLDGRTLTARSVLLCLPAPVAAELYVNPPAEERAFLNACTFTPVLKVSCLLERPLGIAGSSQPYALLVPEVEDSVLSGIIVDHVKHPGRAPAGRGLLSLMADPRLVPDLLTAPKTEVVARLRHAATRYVPGLSAAAQTNFVHAFRHALPEATPRALRLRAGFAARPPGPVDYAGDWLALCPSSEAAVRSGARAASRARARLAAPRLEESVV
ncbi:protoporphyrinogen/coproporphyrinogen oxidase [Actinophytocola sp.]|uniref:protoporphyrinogen/coproporphyrinogen oxidase n=1 Tax=Actinophytocola sp. TaxID=1872138 RepID=UPI00389B09A3